MSNFSKFTKFYLDFCLRGFTFGKGLGSVHHGLLVSVRVDDANDEVVVDADEGLADVEVNGVEDQPTDEVVVVCSPLLPLDV